MKTKGSTKDEIGVAVDSWMRVQVEIMPSSLVAQRVGMEFSGRGFKSPSGQFSIAISF